jgi:hypothetical protein
MMVNVHDVEAHYARSPRATITMELQDAFYGERRYEATDLEGIAGAASRSTPSGGGDARWDVGAGYRRAAERSGPAGAAKASLTARATNRSGAAPGVRGTPRPLASWLVVT